MKPITYRNLFEALKEIPEESLDMFVVVISNLTKDPSFVYDTTLISELPIRLRQDLEDDFSLEQPVLIIGRYND